MSISFSLSAGSLKVTSPAEFVFVFYRSMKLLGRRFSVETKRETPTCLEQQVNALQALNSKLFEYNSISWWIFKCSDRDVRYWTMKPNWRSVKNTPRWCQTTPTQIPVYTCLSIVDFSADQRAERYVKNSSRMFFDGRWMFCGDCWPFSWKAGITVKRSTYEANFVILVKRQETMKSLEIKNSRFYFLWYT